MCTNFVTAIGLDEDAILFSKRMRKYILHETRDVQSTAENRVNRSSRKRVLHHVIRSGRVKSRLFFHAISRLRGPRVDRSKFDRNRLSPTPVTVADLGFDPCLLDEEQWKTDIFSIFYFFFINRLCIIIGYSTRQRVSKDPTLNNLSKSQSICTQE